MTKPIRVKKKKRDKTSDLTTRKITSQLMQKIIQNIKCYNFLMNLRI